MSVEDRIRRLESEIPKSLPSRLEAKVLNSRLDLFRQEMMDKFRAVEHKHRDGSVTDDSLDWLTFDWPAIEAHFVDEFCEFFALESDDIRSLMRAIQDKKDFYLWGNMDRGRAGTVAEPDRAKEAVDVANMAFLMWFKAKSDAGAQP